MSWVDVRSPGEYAHAHIPGASNLPLLSDSERAEVGTLYKQVSPEKAYETAFKFVKPKLAEFVSQAARFEQPLTLYCWRGGMRSQSLNKLFQEAGIESRILQGGYKAYRRSVLDFLETPFPFHVLTGLTGSGKTEQLHTLKREGKNVLDLEELANHRGSVFGALGAQPSNEHFENTIAAVLKTFPLECPIWVEDESRLIGSCKIPDTIYTRMRHAPLTEVRCSEEERQERLLREYGAIPQDDLIAAIEKLQKRLGKERTKKAIEAIEQGDRVQAMKSLLSYYDRAYTFKNLH